MKNTEHCHQTTTAHMLHLAATITDYEKILDALAKGRRVKLLKGPYAGRVAMGVGASVHNGDVWIEVSNIPRLDGRTGFIDFATRKDGRNLYRLQDVEVYPSCQ